MPVTDDGNGNLFAWWGEPWANAAVLTGSHFDSVPHGGGYDGPLGIVSGFLGIDRMAGGRPEPGEADRRGGLRRGGGRPFRRAVPRFPAADRRDRAGHRRRAAGL